MADDFYITALKNMLPGASHETRLRIKTRIKQLKQDRTELRFFQKKTLKAFATIEGKKKLLGFLAANF